MKLLILILLLALCIILAASLWIKKPFFDTRPSPAQVASFLPDQATKTENSKVIIVLAGDIMIDRGVEYKIKKEGNGDFRFPFLNIADYLKKADIVFGNLEGPISDKGIRVGSIYSFRHNPEAINGLVFAGFNVLSFANNHAFDYGVKALEDNFARLKAAGIYYVGAGHNEEEAHSPVIKETKGVKVGFLAYTNLGSANWAAAEDHSGIAWVSGKNMDKVKEDIAIAKSKADILIVSMHAVEEYSQKLTDFQKEFARAAIDEGADLVVGHHPHVVQKSEPYKNKWIFYSLGNFIFDQDFSKETMKGQLVEILIENKKLKKVIPREVKINNFFQPELIK